MTKIPRSRNRFELALTVLGISEAIIFASRTVLSYFLVSVLPVGLQQPNETAVLTQLAKSVSFAGDWTYTILTGGGLFSRIGVSITAISIPVAAADVIFIVALLFICFTKSNELTENAPNVLIRFSIAFAIVNAFAIPVLAQDFWLSVAWGNMITASVNPYYIDISPAFLQGIPLDALAQRMTYGPLWALISGFISLVTFKSSFFAAIGFKLLLTGLWISTLRLIQ